MRSTGALGISVGTSLALEQGNLMNFRRIDTMLFNLRTLVRNALESYDKDDDTRYDTNQLMKDTEGDITFLAKYIDTHRNGKPVKMVVYYPSYRGLKGRYPHADIKDHSKGTDKQQKVFKAINGTCEKLLDKYEKLIIATNVGMPPFSGNGVVMTHHPVDLCETSGTGRLKLFESYTGVLKPFTDWNTKLTNGKNLMNIPLNRLTIQIFGDNSTDFMSSKQNIKDLVKTIANDSNWTAASTYSRVKSSIINLPESVDRAGLMMMF